MKNYWLMKSEPDEVSVDDALAAPNATVPWTGVRNYQARNFMRDQMRVLDGVSRSYAVRQPVVVFRRGVKARRAALDARGCAGAAEDTNARAAGAARSAGAGRPDRAAQGQPAFDHAGRATALEPGPEDAGLMSEVVIPDLVRDPAGQA